MVSDISKYGTISTKRHSDDFYRVDNLQRLLHAEVADVFKKIIPPATRMWMADGFKVAVQRNLTAFSMDGNPQSVQRNITAFSMDARIQYRPGHGVTPNDTINIGFKIDEQWAERYVRGQDDFIFRNEITDFVIKIMMVYSKAGKDGTNS